jgi:acetate---CoA ligase (ADP-forming)
VTGHGAVPRAAAGVRPAADAPAASEEAGLRPRPALEAMLEARSVALVGASARPDSLSYRSLLELERSTRVPAVHLVNPRRAGETIRGHPVLGSLEEIDGPVDLVLFAVPDDQLEAALCSAARRGDRSGVIFGSAGGGDLREDGPSLRERLARLAAEAGMAICGAGCMGFISRAIRAVGYLEPAPLPAGSIALVTHSGSAFSALLRADRPFAWSLAVSSGQELVTTTADYVDYALCLPETKVVALVLETLRDAGRFQAMLARASGAGVPVVALTVGASARGRSMVAAHSGALAGSDAAWEALSDRYGMLRVHDLAELCDTVELLRSERRPPSRRADPTSGNGIAAVLDSGAERALLVDVADTVGVPFAEIGPATRARIAAVLDPGLEVDNPLDVWGRGQATEALFNDALVALAEDARVDAVALAVDLVPEYDGDESYRLALFDAAERTAAGGVPLCVLSHVPSALDRDGARRLRDRGVPVLEGTRSGLRALGNLLAFRDHLDRPRHDAPALDAARRDRWRTRLRARDPGAGALAPALLADYGIPALPSVPARSAEEARLAAERLGYPVVVKTAAPGILHKSDVGGVALHLASPAEVTAAYLDLSGRLGPEVTVSEMAGPGVELSVGTFRDPLLGPLVVVGAGGTLVELLADRAVALPPVDEEDARRLVARLRVKRLLDGHRGADACDLDSVLGVIVAVSMVACELGDVLRALEVNPLSCSASGAVALDALLEA